MNASDSNNADKYPLNTLTLKMYAYLDKQDMLDDLKMSCTIRKR